MRTTWCAGPLGADAADSRRLARCARALGIGLIALAAMGCGGGEETKGGGSNGAGSTTGTQQQAKVAVDLAVDASRDGKADPTDPADEDNEERAQWDQTHGASFLANLDDDDGDGLRDADDAIVNGPNDEADLARVMVAASPDAPEGATGSITLDDASKDSIRLFKKGADGTWTLVAGTMDACTADANACMTFANTATLTTDEVRSGVELGIEARRFRVSQQEGTWDGYVSLTYSVLDKDGAKIADDEGVTDDTAVLRVAPWVLFGNLSPFDTVWSAGDSFSQTLVNGISPAATKAGLHYNKIKNWDDQWTQDYFQTAWTAIPGPNGEVHGMRVANARPWGRADGCPVKTLPYYWLQHNFLGADRAIIEIYKKPCTGDSYDSHGNHDLLPPYKNGTDDFPLGRIVHGSGVLSETKEFYKAQEVQGPPLVLDTSWLLVGHVDEFLSYVPAKTDRGWKLLVGSPKLAKSMLEKAQTDGFGATHMFVGKKRYQNGGNGMVSAEVSIDDVLADVDVMQWSQEAQAEIDGNIPKIRDAVGLGDSDILEIPTVFEEEFGGKIAFSPGTVNLLAFGNYIVQPDPFGPEIEGADLFKKDLQDRLGTPANQLGTDGQGLFVYFADDWYTYHILDGEVHCGSNVDAPAPFASVRWWETGR